MSLMWTNPNKEQKSHTPLNRIGGWIEGGRIEDGRQIGGRLAACAWIFSKAVICNGPNYMDTFRDP